MVTKLRSATIHREKILKIAIILTLMGFISSLYFFTSKSPLSLFLFSAPGVACFLCGFLIFCWLLYDDFVKEHTLFDKRSFPPDKIIINEGDVGEEMFIISKGKVEVFTTRGDKKEHICHLKEGEFFGEMALLAEGRRTASVRSITELELIAIGRKNFLSLIKNLPKVGKEIKEIYQSREKSTKNRS